MIFQRLGMLTYPVSAREGSPTPRAREAMRVEDASSAAHNHLCRLDGDVAAEARPRADHSEIGHPDSG